APAINNDNNANNSSDPDYEVIGPGVFRFEYYYLLKNGRVTDWPWDRWDFPDQVSISSPQQIGLSQVEAIAVSIAVINPAGRALINAVSPDRILDLAADMADFKNANGRGVGGQKIGDLEYQWKTVVESDRKSTRLNSSHVAISYAVFCLKKKKKTQQKKDPK